MAPIKVGIFPLLKNKTALVVKAKEIYGLLKPHFMCVYDETGSIGRRYRRQDEIGTPFCVTVDFESLGSDDVTVRDRDTMEQTRISTERLIDYLSGELKQ